MKAREREAARAAAAAAKAAVEAARRVEDEALAEQSNVRLIAGARDALSGAQQLGARCATPLRGRPPQAGAGPGANRGCE